MNTLAKLVSSEFIYAIGWTLIHSLWQCSLIALCVVSSYAFTKKSRASTRYWISVVGLVSCIFASLATFYTNLQDKVSVVIAENNFLNSTVAVAHEPYKQTLSGFINAHINQIVFCWLIGFCLYICKYLADFFYCQRIKNHKNNQASEQWLTAFNELKNNLGITQPVQLRISDIVDIPCIIGHFKPVVLLPASLLTGLSSKQVEVILLHELGHVRRNDYLISSLQTIVTSLYFFNPFVRWISSKMDEERENACDDIAISVCGDPLFYAHTLKEFAEMKNSNTLVLAIAGHKNLLLNRITRLFVRDVSFTKTYGKTFTAITLFLLCAGFSVTGYSTEDRSSTSDIKIRTKNQPDVYANAIPLSIPKESIATGYLGECTAPYSVDEKGKGFDITVNCTNGKPEAKVFLEKQITTAIQNAQFPIKTENGKAVTVKGRELRVRLDLRHPEKPIDGEATASK
ncbi:hypothetical protein GCM10011613_09740 [Cellvibrio zantedeschiae]|uniref:Peptidase M56 domain-containing protein n=1 Tax=Cellvibrio zantedeschiae TaxID=1237077 RepID=A0ABQ3AUH9_9GAMM|nr:M56 family metallopeptidase [Cellvibrio zantedeschiae]GGY67641.1 hypothetical protein GCM10011613_09740 [Cellvibrio zantedeschiae]